MEQGDEGLCAGSTIPVLAKKKPVKNNIPSGFAHFWGLWRLNFIEIHRLELIPEAAYGLTSLVELWLCDNRLTELPPQIGTLRGLRQLWVGSNRLVRVPKCIKHNKQLRSLGLENNLLTDLVSFARIMALDRC